MKKIFYRMLSVLGVLLVLAGMVVPVSAENAQPEIYSGYYQVDGSLIRGVLPGTTGELLCKVCAPSGLTAPEGPLATGDQLTDGEQSLTVVVTADINGDAKVTITDLLMLKAHLLGTQMPTVAAAAADINYDSKVTITDFLRLKANLLGMEQIQPGRTEEPGEALLLLQPGGSANWPVSGAAAYQSSDETLVTVNDEGTVQAQALEGTAVVWALDARGAQIGRVLVTVLEEPLTITLEQEELRLAMGSATKLAYQLNYPVDTQVTWSTSDAAVVSVAPDGTVSPLKPGSAVVSAQLP